MQSKIKTGEMLITQGVISFIKLKPTAEDPFKDDSTNIGYEITISERCDSRAEDVYGDVNTFGTGLVLVAPKHHHLEVIESPHLYKAGYSLMGAPRIIDPSNKDELILPLYKYKDCEDLELPFRAAVVVLRTNEYCPVYCSSIRNEEPVQSRGNQTVISRGNQTKVQQKSTSLSSSATARPTKGSKRSNMF